MHANPTDDEQVHFGTFGQDLLQHPLWIEKTSRKTVTPLRSALTPGHVSQMQHCRDPGIRESFFGREIRRKPSQSHKMTTAMGDATGSSGSTGIYR
jgi:hypothetical protein